MDIGTVRGLITALVLALFVGISIWSFSRRRQAEFEQAARLPLGDDTRPPGEEDRKEQPS